MTTNETTIDQKLDAILSAQKSQEGSINNLLGRVRMLEGKTPDAPAPSTNLIADTVKATLADEKQRTEFLGQLDVETLANAEKAAAAEIDNKLWKESKTQWLGRKAKQHGPRLALGAAMGIGGTLAVQRYRASRVEVIAEADNISMMPAAMGGKK